MDDEELDPTKYYEHRAELVSELKKDPKFFPYPHKYPSTHSIQQLKEKFQPNLKENGVFLDEIVATTGRIKLIRVAGKNLIFFIIVCDDHRIQLIYNPSEYVDVKHFEKIYGIIGRGDIIGARGKIGLSKSGEFSIQLVELQLLSPCLYMLPKKENGLVQVETRYRQRYLDLIVNTRPREIFKMRSKVISLLRQELESRGFLEVETPVLNIIPGGATARPFETFHFDLQMKMFMRIAPELYLKMCVIGGLDRVYEIGKNFRNEGIDKTHNPEFTSCELYQAYADYQDLMTFTEEVLCSIVEKVKGGLKFQIAADESGRKVDIDFTRPWKRISIMEELERVVGVKLP